MTLNPIFWFVLFSLGYVFGLLLKNPTGGKFLIFGFLGIAVYEPVRDAGLMASAFFLLGIISHHLSLLGFLEELPRFLPRRSRRPTEDDPKPRRAGKGSESAEETRSRYEEYVKGKRGQKSEGGAEKEACGSKRKKPSREAGARGQAQESEDGAALRREKIRQQQERERQDREREKLRREREELEELRRLNRPPEDTRTDEEVLGLTGAYTLAELKQARNREVQRWNTSNMRHKPQHLREQAEEEAKKINLAYDRLVGKFR